MDLKSKREQIIANINYLQGQLALIKEMEDECALVERQQEQKESQTTPLTEESQENTGTNVPPADSQSPTPKQ